MAGKTAQSTSGFTYGEPFLARIGNIDLVREVCEVFFKGRFVFYATSFSKIRIEQTVIPIKGGE